MVFKKIFNKANLPIVGTIASCVGVGLAMGFAAKAGWDCHKIYISGDGTKIDMAKKCIVPLIFGGGTIALIGVTTGHYRKTVAGLGTAVAALSSQVADINAATKEIVGEEKFNEIGEKVDTKRGIKDWQDDSSVIVLDPDGALYFDQLTGLKVRAFSETILNGFYKLNRNYQLRGGYATVYELYRMWGVKKADIKRLGLEWTNYIGWHEYFLSMDGMSFIDWHPYEGEVMDTGEHYHCINYDSYLTPVCMDPPEIVHSICHTDPEELEELLMEKEDVDAEIACEIGDSYIE